jgi:hypothetical protein
MVRFQKIEYDAQNTETDSDDHSDWWFFCRSFQLQNGIWKTNLIFKTVWAVKASDVNFEKKILDLTYSLALTIQTLKWRLRKGSGWDIYFHFIFCCANRDNIFIFQSAFHIFYVWELPGEIDWFVFGLLKKYTFIVQTRLNFLQFFCRLKQPGSLGRTYSTIVIFKI